MPTMNSEESAFVTKRINLLLVLILLTIIISTMVITSGLIANSQSCNPPTMEAALEEIVYKQRQLITRQDALIKAAFGQSLTPTTSILSKEVTLTAYTARPEETNANPHVTAFNSPTRIGIIAVSRDLEALGLVAGTRVLIEPYGLFQVDDRTSTHKRKNTSNPIPIRNTIDILHANLAAARKFGIQTATIKWLSKGA